MQHFELIAACKGGENLRRSVSPWLRTRHNFPGLALTLTILFGSLGLLPSLGNAAPKLPEGLQWLSNDNPPAIGSPKATKGGKLTVAILSYPLTFRTVGPDSNTGIRNYLLANDLSLTSIHPNTDAIIPGIATSWAFGDDKKTVYYKLDPKARYSDGHPVTAEDFAYTLEFMRSPHIVAPWYNEMYSKEFDKVIVYNKHTLAVVLPRAKPEIHLYADLPPTPRHFYKKLNKGFPKDFNWKIVPNTGPYKISKFRKGKTVTFARKKDWWAKDRPYFQGRFNIDKIVLKVVRDMSVAMEYLKRGKIDYYHINMPTQWHDQAKGTEFDRGYIEKLWFYQDAPAPDYLLEMNTRKEPFNDKNVRIGFSHAINIEKVIATVLRGEYERQEAISRGFGKYTNTTIKARTYSLDKANAAFDAAGYDKRGPDGIRIKGNKRLSAKVTYGSDAHTPRLVVMREELKRAGFDLELHKLDPSSSYKYGMEKKHQVIYVGWSGGLRPQYWGQLHSENAGKSGSNHYTGYTSKELDEWTTAYRNSTDLEERITLAHKIQQAVHDAAINVPLFRVPYFRVAMWRWLKLPEPPGTRYSDSIEPFGISSGGIIWIDEKLKKETLTAKKKGVPVGKPVVVVDKTFAPK